MKIYPMPKLVYHDIHNQLHRNLKTMFIGIEYEIRIYPDRTQVYIDGWSSIEVSSIEEGKRFIERNCQHLIIDNFEPIILPEIIQSDGNLNDYDYGQELGKENYRDKLLDLNKNIIKVEE